MQVTMSGSGVCSHTQHLQHSHRTCSRPIASLSSAFRRGCSLQTRQQAARPQRTCRLAAQAAFGEGDEEDDSNRRRGRRRREDDQDSGPDKETDEKDNFEERLVQVRRVTKVVKGGKQLSFRAVVVVGDKLGTVGVGCGSAKEIAQAVDRAVLLAKRESVTFPLNKSYSLPHRIDGYWGAAKVMLRPAADGAGVIAGGAVRVVLELAGVRNCFGKQLGSANPLNNARATIEGMRALRTFKMVSQQRGISVQELMGLDAQPQEAPSPAVADAMAGQV